MGDRVSIRFVNWDRPGDNTAPVLFSHWGGQRFPAFAREYVTTLRLEVAENRGVKPMDRLEPGTVTVDFVYQLGRQGAYGERVESDLYFGLTEEDGDNSDNGHYDIDLGRGGV